MRATRRSRVARMAGSCATAFTPLRVTPALTGGGRLGKMMDCVAQVRERTLGRRRRRTTGYVRNRRNSS